MPRYVITPETGQPFTLDAPSEHAARMTAAHCLNPDTQVCGVAGYPTPTGGQWRALHREYAGASPTVTGPHYAVTWRPL